MAAPQFYISGSDLPIQIKSHFSWQRGVGGRRVDIWTGLYADMVARMPGWQVDYDEINLTPDENSPAIRAELVLNSPEPEVNWEIIPTRVELDLLNTATANALKNVPYIELDEDFVPASEDNSTVLLKLRAIMQDQTSFTYEFDDVNVPTGNQAIWDTANELADLIVEGQRAVPRSLPVLRLNQTVASRYSQKLSVTFLGAVISTAALYSLEGVPADVLFDVPPDHPARFGFRWGWLKVCPTIRRTGRGFFSIQQDWEYGEYPLLPLGLFTFIPPYP